MNRPYNSDQLDISFVIFETASKRSIAGENILVTHLQPYFEKSLKKDANNILGIPITKFRKDTAIKLMDRIENIRLYAHTYAFFHNFKYGAFDIDDLIKFAYQEGLQGILHAWRWRDSGRSDMGGRHGRGPLQGR